MKGYTMNALATKLHKLGACRDALRFVEGFETLRAAWKECTRSGWKEWLLKTLCPALWADCLTKRAALWADYVAKYDALSTDYAAKRAPLWADCAAKRAALLESFSESIFLALEQIQ